MDNSHPVGGADAARAAHGAGWERDYPRPRGTGASPSPSPVSELGWGGLHLFHVGTTSGAGGHPFLRGLTEGLEDHRCPYPRPGLTGSSGLPLSDPPCPGLTGSLGLTSPLQLWQKNRCCGTAAAAASAIFPHCRRCRHSSRGSKRGPERPRASGELVCSAPSPESAGERRERLRGAGSGRRSPCCKPPNGEPGGGSGSGVTGSGHKTWPLSRRRRRARPGLGVRAGGRHRDP